MTPSPGLSVCMLVQRTIEHDSRVRREATALARAGHQVTVVEMSPTGPPVTGFRRTRLQGSSLLERLPLRVQQPVAVLAFALEACRQRPDVIHAHDVLMLPAGQLAARLGGAQLVYDTHELATGVPYRRGLLARLARAVERLGIGRARVVLTVSEPIAERLYSAYGLPRRPLVLRNVCALPRPGPTPTSPGLRETLGIGDRPLVLHQGAAAGGRGCETLVLAMREVAGAHLVFLGPCDDDYRASLQALARGAGCADRVHFHPPVPPESLLERTSEADVGVSMFEPTSENYRLTIPNKLFEYVAAGVPVVTSNVAGVRDLVQDTEIGWTADPLDTSSVAAALGRALDTRGDDAVSQRLAAADARFSWETEQTVLLEAYRSMSSS